MSLGICQLPVESPGFRFYNGGINHEELGERDVMPIYEYQAVVLEEGCSRCRSGFEVLQWVHEEPIETCPECGGRVRKIPSLCHAAIMEVSEEHKGVTRTIGEYERAGMYSHAAELADKHSEKSNDSSMKSRAMDNYKKAGYDVKTLDKHASSTKTGTD